jgi:hypothetical protein
MRFRGSGPVSTNRRGLVSAAAWPLLVAVAACSSNTNGDSCTPGDQDGVLGGPNANVVLVSVSDTAFAVGGVDSGSTARNIAIQNSSKVTLTLTNVGTKPHDLVIQCIPTGLPAGCPATSCFPKNANIPPVPPGQNATTTFTVPVFEGAYLFTSDEAGDTEKSPDGSLTGLVGEFVLI